MIKNSATTRNKCSDPGGVPRPEAPIRVPGRPGPTPGGLRFRTLQDAERVLQRIANLVLERERSVLERDATTEARRRAESEGVEPRNLSLMPALRGLSNEAAGKIINSINTFIISRRFQDEFVAKTRVKELEAEVLQLLQRVEEYRQRVAELMARQQKMMQ